MPSLNNSKPIGRGRRARSDEAKKHRREKILHAANTLLDIKRFRLPSLSEIANKAAITKGTIYLYFETKDHVYMNLLQQGYLQWIEMFNQAISVHGKDLGKIMKRYSRWCHENPKVLFLASQYATIFEKNVSAKEMDVFNLAIAQAIGLSTRQISTTFDISQAAAQKLAVHSYALSLGLWQQSHPPNVAKRSFKKKEAALFDTQYEKELQTALMNLWKGATS